MTRSTSLFPLALALVLCGLLVLADGALVTGDFAGTPPLAAGLAATVHPWIGAALGILALVVAIRLAGSDAPGALRRLGWILVGVVVLEGALSARGGMSPMYSWAGVLHACLGHLFFVGSIALMVCTSSGFQRGPDLVEDYGWPSLRSLAVSTPAVLLFQIYLGAGLRHNAMGALSHIGFAMVAALWVLLECVFVIQQFPKHRALRPMANGLLAVTFAQVFLGIAAFTLRTMEITGPAVAAVTAAHVATGSIVLSLAVALSIHIRRNVMPKGSLSAAAAQS